MSATIVAQDGDKSKPPSLERGRFSDGVRVLTVVASGAVAPDSFQVYADGNRADIVLIVSGLNSGNLRATWGDGWRTASEAWKEWAKDQSFMAFYNGKRASLAPTTTPGSRNTRGARQVSAGKVRFCDG